MYLSASSLLTKLKQPMSNKTVIVRPVQYNPRPRPNWVHFCLLIWAGFKSLAPRQKLHAGVLVMVVFLPIGMGVFAFIDKVAASVHNERPADTPRMTMMAPANITLSVEESGKPSYPKPARKKNDAAPRSVSELAPIDTEAYIRRWKGAAIQSMRATGVPASIILAQGIVESNSGKSYLATQANNHFGIKCSTKRCWKGHCVNRTDDTHKDFFLKFKSASEAFNFHGKFLSQGRYVKLHRYGKNYRDWAIGLKRVGYATDRNYANTLIGTIERFRLYEYD